jgi:hypothetical protein
VQIHGIANVCDHKGLTATAGDASAHARLPPAGRSQLQQKQAIAADETDEA